MNDALPLHAGSELWFENNRTPLHANELMLKIPDGVHIAGREFWLTMSAPDGATLGWLCFSHVVSIRGEPIFAASQWRPCCAGAPPAQALLWGIEELHRIRHCPCGRAAVACADVPASGVA